MPMNRTRGTVMSRARSQREAIVSPSIRRATEMYVSKVFTV